jgi:hypothetical protein
MSRFIVYTGGHAVAYAPTFTSEAEAEAWVNRIGENGGWEERVDIYEEEDDTLEERALAYQAVDDDDY